MTATIPRLKPFIGGAWAPSTSDRWIDDVNPSDARDIVQGLFADLHVSLRDGAWHYLRA